MWAELEYYVQCAEIIKKMKKTFESQFSVIKPLLCVKINKQLPMYNPYKILQSIE